jgi:aminomethyltransferase
MRRTPLYDAHVAAKAVMVEFAGWEMPVQYAGAVEETKHVRTKAGIFDLCHMGRLVVTGPEAVQAVDSLVSCNVAKLKTGVCKYGILCNEKGGSIDDVLVYKDEDRVHVIINAGNRDRDFRHFLEHCGSFECEVENASDGQTMIAVQGPSAVSIVAPLAGPGLDGLGYYRFTHGKVLGVPCLVSRTGYTGEDGFELFFAAKEARAMWDGLLEKGRSKDLRPIGLAARDILRTEAGMPLYGHELDDDTNPLEAGLTFGVDLSKEFWGSAAVKGQVEAGLKRKLVGLRLDQRVARPGYAVLSGGKARGKVTSGTPSPTLGTNIAMAFVDAGFDPAGGRCEVDIRGKPSPAAIVPLPFYKRERKKQAAG